MIFFFLFLVLIIKFNIIVIFEFTANQAINFCLHKVYRFFFCLCININTVNVKKMNNNFFKSKTLLFAHGNFLSRGLLFTMFLLYQSVDQHTRINSKIFSPLFSYYCIVINQKTIFDFCTTTFGSTIFYNVYLGSTRKMFF